MSTDLRITPRSERQVLLKTESKAPLRQVPINFRGGRIDVPVVRVSVWFPVYRMENGRTSVEQLDYIRRTKDVPPDFFSSGEENSSVQREQHSILLDMARDEKGPIYQEFERSRFQEGELLVTAAGVTVNGNRRMAAMRDLFEKSPSDYKSFEFVDVAVLPEYATAEDLELIETELQMAVETKLEYSWVDRRLKVNHLIEKYHLTAEKIASVMHYGSASTVKEELRELDLVNDYLGAFLGTPGDYKAVASSEQIFHNMAQSLAKKIGDDREIAKLLGFNLVKEADKLGTRAYEYRDVFGKWSSKVSVRIAPELGVALVSDDIVDRQASTSPQDDDDPLAGLGAMDTPSNDALIAVLKDQTRSADVVKQLTSIHESIKAAERQESNRSLALENVRKSHTLLASVDLSRAASDSLGEIRNQLVALLSSAIMLRNQIDELTRDSSARSAS